ncbi:MAG: DUF1175 family protein [Acidobacteriaceae bacterium]|nr:DUF1175 family protein [Acidobacteriaceae bacterium]MBV9294817.1 DUF1175 family protein [Acidobacteriaceae bacterium]MBV9766223.1 DUF1175 family protein [Acidobacteriaceae bacterium]
MRSLGNRNVWVAALFVSTLAAEGIRDHRLSQATDWAGDGTPDYLRLDDQADQQSFRRWFAFLAEVQYFTPPAERPAEVVDCAALVRYAYREALRKHDGSWTQSAHLILVPALDSVKKYNFPHTPLGPAIFRIRPGPFQASDLQTGAFAQFANGAALERFNTFFVTRDVSRAVPGDLLFFHQESEHMPFHAMIYVGRSQLSESRSACVVYHTGPDGTKPGEIRRLSLEELLHYPDPRWQPRSTNPFFLGVFRWNILRTPT